MIKLIASDMDGSLLNEYDGLHSETFEIISSVFYSYAMKNAPDDVKRHARFITNSNIENGVLSTTASANL